MLRLGADAARVPGRSRPGRQAEFGECRGADPVGREAPAASSARAARVLGGVVRDAHLAALASEPPRAERALTAAAARSRAVRVLVAGAALAATAHARAALLGEVAGVEGDHVSRA